MIRCVVTGEREDGKSVVVSDEMFEFTPLTLVSSQTESVRLWGEEHTPQLPTDGTPHEQPTYLPLAGGFRLLAITLAPDSTESALNSEYEPSIRESGTEMPGYISDPDHPGMHRTDSVDLDVVISGEVWLELDDGKEIHLRAGDCVIQNGTRHAWRNHSDTPCRIFAAVIGATRTH